MTFNRSGKRSGSFWKLATRGSLRAIALGCLLMVISSPAAARVRPLRSLKRAVIVLRSKPWFQPLEHAAIGAGVAFAVSEAAGGTRDWKPGLAAACITAGFKEGSDAWNGSDNRANAALDAAEIAAGAGALAAYGASK